jgi:hypothetical protein
MSSLTAVVLLRQSSSLRSGGSGAARSSLPFLAQPPIHVEYVAEIRPGDVFHLHRRVPEAGLELSRRPAHLPSFDPLDPFRRARAPVQERAHPRTVEQPTPPLFPACESGPTNGGGIAEADLARASRIPRRLGPILPASALHGTDSAPPRAQVSASTGARRGRRPAHRLSPGG